MGIETQVMLNGFVSAEDITKFLSKKYSDVKNNVSKTSYQSTCDLVKEYGEDSFIVKDGSDVYNTISGFITFIDTATGKRRMLHYFYDNIRFTDELSGTINRTDTENKAEFIGNYVMYGVKLSLSYYGRSVEIMKEILEEFGGWIDENDYDDIGYKYIKKKSVLT
jgi:hypothetical protein